ncbi:MAG TPA: RluA family pseudouridine synthase [Candidatus Saccharimonadales bacterium]|nr:RluA family pseudouridine synthase [Candidatus Saccharimonadales bacterium]
MVKVSSRDILDVLRRYEMADDDNVPRNVENVKITHPNPINTLASFRFLNNHLYLLLDDTAEDDISYALDQIKTKNSNVKGEFIKNPRDKSLTYAMPFRGKEVYLFEVISDKKRLDSELAKRYPETSRSTWQKHILAGHISVNGEVITSSKHEITENDKISIEAPEMPDFSKKQIPIIFIDDNVIVINKPSGVLTHAKGELNDEFTIAEFFRRYSTYNLDSNRPGIIHRLDRDTSGVMIGARNPESAVLLQKQFADRKTKKTYFAVLSGIPKLPIANIDLPIGRNPSKPSMFRVDVNGKPATTRYEVIATNDRYSFVKLQPKTGRTHQLRVHMKYIGTPILGDKLYGKPSDRLYLHAYSLEITIPSGDRRTFTAPLPNDLTKRFPGVNI